MSGRREWPRGANAGPTKLVNSCSCGFMSTGPITPDTHRCRLVVTGGRDRKG